MSVYNPTLLFDTLKNRETQNSEGGSRFGNENVFKPKTGKTYVLRLLWLAPDGTNREYPMINQFVHHIWDDEVTSGSKDVTVYCKTSQYDMNETRQAFKECPICAKASELYQAYQKDGSKLSKDLYAQFSRKLRGYVPVYVVDGPIEDKGKVKILHYGKLFKTFFDKKIFGIVKQNKNAEANGEEVKPISADEIIGVEAFMYYDPKAGEVVTRGYDLIVTVDTKKVPVDGKMVDMPDYNLDFSRKERNIEMFGDVEITPEYFNGLSEELRFDKDFYKTSTVTELEQFKAKYIDNHGQDDILDEPEDEVDEDASALDRLKQSREARSSAAKNVPTAEEDEEVAERKTTIDKNLTVTSSPTMYDSKTSDSDDLDDIINNL